MSHSEMVSQTTQNPLKSSWKPPEADRNHAEIRCDCVSRKTFETRVSPCSSRTRRTLCTHWFQRFIIELVLSGLVCEDLFRTARILKSLSTFWSLPHARLTKLGGASNGSCSNAARTWMRHHITQPKCSSLGRSESRNHAQTSSSITR